MSLDGGRELECQERTVLCWGKMYEMQSNFDPLEATDLAHNNLKKIC